MRHMVLKFSYILIAVMTAALVSGEPLRADDDDIPSVTVTGTGTALGVPDRAKVQAGASALAPTAKGAMAIAAARSVSIVAAARKAGLKGEDIQTGAVNLHPQFRRGKRGEPDTGPVITGYKARLGYSFTIRDIGAVGSTVDALVRAGANEVGGVRLYIADTQGLADKARASAMTDARRNAEILAQAEKLFVGRVLAIEEGSAGGPVPMRALSVERASIPIEPGQIEHRARVRVTYALKEKP